MMTDAITDLGREPVTIPKKIMKLAKDIVVDSIDNTLKLMKEHPEEQRHLIETLYQTPLTDEEYYLLIRALDLLEWKIKNI